MINIVWFILVICGLVFYFITGSVDMSEVILNTSYDTLDMIKSIGPLIVLWCGVMNIAEKSGLLLKFSKILTPLLKKLMPSVKNDKAFLYISSNIVANMLGLGSVATPAGLKAMKELDKDNKESKIASDGMITFLVLNTSGVTIIPMSVIALRMGYGSIDPSKVIIPSIMATFVISFCGLLLDYIIRRKNAK